MFIGKLRRSGCLALVISLVSPVKKQEDPEYYPSSTKRIRIEEAIKLEEKAHKAQQRAAQKQRNITNKQKQKTHKDRKSWRESSAQVVNEVTPVGHATPETVNTSESAVQQPRTDIRDKAIAQKEADNAQWETYELLPYAFPAINAFVDHGAFIISSEPAVQLILLL